MTTLTSSGHSLQSSTTRLLLMPGAIGGLIGGMTMAMLSMVVAINGDGFWAPVRGITSVVFGDQHYGGSFSFWSVVVGLGAHMMNSVVLGAMFGLLVAIFLRRAGTPTVWMAGAAFGLAVWAILVPGLAHGLQTSDLFVDSVPEWTWITGHVVFGLMTGMIVVRFRDHRA